MADIYDVIAPRTYKDRQGNEKSSFTKVGVAFPMRDRDGFNVQLEAIPAPQDGVFRLMLMRPKPRDEQSSEPRQSRQSMYDGGSFKETPTRSARSDDFATMDDEIPF